MAGIYATARKQPPDRMVVDCHSNGCATLAGAERTLNATASRYCGRLAPRLFALTTPSLEVSQASASLPT